MSDVESSPEFEQLPALYQRWVRAWLPAGIPRERNATCHDCAMAAPDASCGGEDLGYYDRGLKCCTYFPDIPNFLAGRALAEDNPGADALRAFVTGADTRFQATLHGIQPGPKLITLYDQHHKQGFGRDPDLLCPYAIDRDAPEGPRCGIWQQRNGVCSTFFCKHVKGLTGYQFWQTMRGLLGQLENALAWWAILELIDAPDRVFSAGARRAGDRNAILIAPDAWRFWPGTREAFYRACAERVEALDPEEAVAIAGQEARLYRLELDRRAAELRATEPPSRLRAAPFNVLRQAGGRTTIQALTCAEPFEAPDALVPLLRYFDGGPTPETIESIREATKIRLEPKLVRRLFDLGILERLPEAGTEI